MVITNILSETKNMKYLLMIKIWQRDELFQKLKNSHRSEKVITAKFIKNGKNIDCQKFLKVTKTIAMMVVTNVSSETKNMKHLSRIKNMARR